MIQTIKKIQNEDSSYHIYSDEEGIWVEVYGEEGLIGGKKVPTAEEAEGWAVQFLKEYSRYKAGLPFDGAELEDTQ